MSNVSPSGFLREGKSFQAERSLRLAASKIYVFRAETSTETLASQSLSLTVHLK